MPVTTSIARALAGAVFLGCMFTGCSEDPAQSIESEHIWQQRFQVAPTIPHQLILVVDDAPTAEAASLRADVIAGLRTSVLHLLSESTPSDPASHTAFDLSVVLVFPSGPAEARIVGPPEDPGLAIRSDDTSNADVEALVARTEALLSASLSDPTQAYQPIEAITAAATLIQLDRPPNDPLERALVDALVRPVYRNVQLVVASTRDDESPLSPEQYSLLLGEHDWGYSSLAAFLAGGEESDCLGGGVLPGSRLLQWATVVDNDSSYVLPSSCLASEPESGLFGLSYDHGGGSGWCTSKPIALLPNWQPQCRVFVNTDDCDPERGWAPLADGTCEMVQLEGDALRACETDLSCEGCVSGWCRSEPLEPLESNHGCGPLGHPARLRFPGTSVFGTGASFEITCALETGE